MTGPTSSSIDTAAHGAEADPAADAGAGHESDPGTWGPTVRGGRVHPLARRLLLIAAFGGAGVVVVLALLAFTLYRVADGNLTKIEFREALAAPDPGGPLNVLIVGSDARGDLTEQERIDLVLGEFDGQRSDTVMLVSVAGDRSGVSVLSFPRDLRVLDDGRVRKLTETYGDGPENIVEVVADLSGVPIHHYAEVSFTGFLSVVDALGGVRICIDERLVDDKTGADFRPGCQQLDAKQSLSYVRSRQGSLGDIERIRRQQTFMKALLVRLVETRTVIDVPRLFRVIDRVASNVTTDSALGLGEIRTLADELRGLADGSVPMSSVPARPERIGGKEFMVAYGPGARALFQRLADGEVLAELGAPDLRAAHVVAVWSDGRAEEAGTVVDTLAWSGYAARGAGAGPLAGGATTTVYALEGYADAADWVATTLGAPLLPLPDDVTPPADAHVVVVAGDDATT